MRLSFQLRFHTTPGQSLFLTGNHPLLGNDEIESAVALRYLDWEFWRVDLEVPQTAITDRAIPYRYLLRQADGTMIEDWADDRVLELSLFKTPEVLLIDSWNHPGFNENAYYSEPFQEVLLKCRQDEFRVPSPDRATHLFKVKAPLLEKGQTLCLLGSDAALGNWDAAKPLLLNRVPGQPWLSAEVDFTGHSFPIEYKYGIYDFKAGRFVGWESGSNRVLNDSIGAGKQTRINDGFAVLPTTRWKGAGVAIPVFSLRTQSSFGVGEFSDLKLLVDWCRKVGLKLIQILPVNDTTATHTAADSYPYAAISAFALHPLYLNLQLVAQPAQQHLVLTAEKERQRLNALKDLDYEAVMRLKLNLVRKLYELQKDATFGSREYQAFFAANRHWLVPYAVFCYLRDENGTPEFSRWRRLRNFDQQQVNALAEKGSPAAEEVAFHFFVQYHLHVQLRQAAAYAHSQGIILKGDIAIGVARNGVDAWQQPELYRMEMQAGAPPDAFGIKGQNWSFPTYNWERIKQTGFAWWKERFAQMADYFDAFRIDHILGFFRIWSIPIEAVEGILGHFVPAIPVRLDEFRARGLRFDHDRYLKPFISDSVLGKIFGEDAAEVKVRFLEAAAPGTYRLKPQFATQRQVQRYFTALEDSEQNQRLQAGLLDLISNVILLPDENASDQFHFRFSIETTSSFQSLDVQTQNQLRDLYLDYFFRRQDEFWMREAMQKLPLLKRVTNMLICGEDLGMVPACVPEVMKQLGLLSLEVQRMPKRLGEEFSQPKDAPHLAVVTPGTHDMSTIRGWWHEDRAVTQRFYNTCLGVPGTAPEECETWVSRAIVQQHLDSPAMWSIFMLQDLLGLNERLRRDNPAEERINVPADPKNYWRYRMHLFVEDLLTAGEYNQSLRDQIEQSGR